MKRLFRYALIAASLAIAALAHGAGVTLWSPIQGDLNFPYLTAGPNGGISSAPGSFTTLSASGAVSGAGFTARFASPGPIGSTTASTGSFTTLSATTINGNTFTAGTGVLTIAAAKTLTASNTLTLAGTDSTTMTFPSTSASVARTDAAQTFTGIQTFSSPPILAVAPVTAPCTSHAYTVAATDTYIIANDSATCTFTMPAPSTNVGRRLVIKTIAAFTVVSAGSNVVPQASATAGTAMLAGTAGKFAELVSDGTNWITFAAN